MEKKITLRERTRRAVQKEIIQAAQTLFLEHGFEATTIQQIADKVGMSKRSMFRHFPTKEDLIIGKFDMFTNEVIDILNSRPLDEPIWQSLTIGMHTLSQHLRAPQKHDIAHSMEEIIFKTPSLHGTYLQRLQKIQEAIVSTLLERAATAGTPFATDDPTPQALVAAAMACAAAAKHSWLTSGAKSSYSSFLDQAMNAVKSN